VLLDVDGVIHDAAARYAIRFSDNPDAVAVQLGVKAVRVHGRLLAIPDYMPGLIQELVSVADVHWCTTWKSRANALCEPLGIGPLPVVDDGGPGVGFDWKVQASSALVAEALAADRDVFWIEDFNDVPRLEDSRISRIDTTADGKLKVGDLVGLVRAP
jgi:hypothetical protein